MSYTPGPWTIESGKLAGDCTMIWTDNRSICRIDIPDEEDEANARLICAAPALVAALEEAVKHHCRLCHGAGLEHADDCQIGIALKEAGRG